MRRSLSIGGSSSVQWRKVGRSWRLRTCFRRLLCVRIEIDQLQCVNCWVIIHCLSVSNTNINHSRFVLVIWSSLQLTPKQWIITQQFTAGADLFLKWMNLFDLILLKIGGQDTCVRYCIVDTYAKQYNNFLSAPACLCTSYIARYWTIKIDVSMKHAIRSNYCIFSYFVVNTKIDYTII